MQKQKKNFFKTLEQGNFTRFFDIIFLDHENSESHEMFYNKLHIPVFD